MPKFHVQKISLAKQGSDRSIIDKMIDKISEESSKKSINLKKERTTRLGKTYRIGLTYIDAKQVYKDKKNLNRSISRMMSTTNLKVEDLDSENSISL